MVNCLTCRSGGSNSALLVSVQLVELQFALNCHVSVQCSPTVRLAPEPGVLVTFSVSGTDPDSGASGAPAWMDVAGADVVLPHRAATETWYFCPVVRPVSS